MNEVWISDSHESAAYYRSGQRYDPEENMQIIRILDTIGMFETSWLLFNHPHNKYGYPALDWGK